MVDRFIPIEIIPKLLVALGIGLTVGFEREWAGKDVGVRTFAIVSLMGMLTTLESQVFAWIGMAAVVILVTVMNVGNIIVSRDLEITTSVALVVTFALGVLVGEGHVFTPVASAILMTLLLSLKPELATFADGVTAQEVRAAILLGLIGFVIYPILPEGTLDPWALINPREAWLTVILISGLEFINYWLLRVYGARGLIYMAVFGGFVNSTATAAELAHTVDGNGPGANSMAGLAMVTSASMLVRNLAIITVFDRAAGAVAFWPIAAMCLVAALFAFRTTRQKGEIAGSKLSTPISLRKVSTFALLFLLIRVMASLGHRFLGSAGSVAVSFLGGFASSASSTAAAGSLAASGAMDAWTAALCTLLTSVASMIVTLPLVSHHLRGRSAFRRLLAVSAVTITIGFAALGAVYLLSRNVGA